MFHEIKKMMAMILKMFNSLIQMLDKINIYGAHSMMVALYH